VKVNIVEMLEWSFGKGAQQAETRAELWRVRERLERLEPNSKPMGMAMDAAPRDVGEQVKPPKGFGAAMKKFKPKPKRK
jgi:hypothetical protein